MLYKVVEQQFRSELGKRARPFHEGGFFYAFIGVS
jgi:hypothetical protein